MTPEQAIKHYGTRANIAAACEVTDTAVGLWFKQGWIPFDKQSTMEVDSGNALKADWLDLPDKKRPKHLRTAAA